MTYAVSTYAYAYAVPADLLLPTAILDPEATDDLQVRTTQTLLHQQFPLGEGGELAPASQPFDMETDNLGNRVLLTNQADAVVKYTRRNVPFELWHPLARQAVAYRTASLMAGDLVKDAKLARAMYELSEAFIYRAAASDAKYQRDVRPELKAPWLP